MEELAVNELLLRVKSGDEPAFSLLCDRFQPLLSSLVSAIADSCVGFSRDELLQEARLALYHAVKSYRTEQDEVTFGLYAKICVRNALVSRSRRRLAVAVCSLDELREQGDFGDSEVDANPECQLIGKEEVEELRSRVRSILSEFEYSVFLCYVDGLDTEEIAAVLARPLKSVRNASHRLFTKIRLLLR